MMPETSTVDVCTPPVPITASLVISHVWATALLPVNRSRNEYSVKSFAWPENAILVFPTMRVPDVAPAAANAATVAASG